jgi:hypothetical protein
MPAFFARDAAHGASSLKLFERLLPPSVAGRLGISASEHSATIAASEQNKNILA